MKKKHLGLNVLILHICNCIYIILFQKPVFVFDSQFFCILVKCSNFCLVFMYVLFYVVLFRRPVSVPASPQTTGIKRYRCQPHPRLQG